MTIVTMIDVKPYSLKDLAVIYGVCDKTLKKWIQPFVEDVGEKNGRYYSVAQVKVIFEKLGVPSKMQEE